MTDTKPSDVEGLEQMIALLRATDELQANGFVCDAVNLARAMIATKAKPSDVDGLIEAIAVELSDKMILRLDVHEDSPILSQIIDELRDRLATTLAAQQAELKTVLDREAATIARYDAKLDERDARIAAQQAENARLREVLENMISHCHEMERCITEDLHHADFAGESIVLCNARAALKEPS